MIKISTIKGTGLASFFKFDDDPKQKSINNKVELLIDVRPLQDSIEKSLQTCVKMILNHYSLPIPKEIQSCTVFKEIPNTIGPRLVGKIHHARDLRDIKKLLKKKTPVLALIFQDSQQNEQPVLMKGIDSKTLYINNPVSGSKQVPIKIFNKGWKKTRKLYIHFVKIPLVQRSLDPYSRDKLMKFGQELENHPTYKIIMRHNAALEELLIKHKETINAHAKWQEKYPWSHGRGVMDFNYFYDDLKEHVPVYPKILQQFQQKLLNLPRSKRIPKFVKQLREEFKKLIEQHYRWEIWLHQNNAFMLINSPPFPIDLIERALKRVSYRSCSYTLDIWRDMEFLAWRIKNCRHEVKEDAMKDYRKQLECELEQKLNDRCRKCLRNHNHYDYHDENYQDNNYCYFLCGIGSTRICKKNKDCPNHELLRSMEQEFKNICQ